jgi:hypothetical protein
MSMSRVALVLFLAFTPSAPKAMSQFANAQSTLTTEATSA